MHRSSIIRLSRVDCLYCTGIAIAGIATAAASQCPTGIFFYFAPFSPPKGLMVLQFTPHVFPCRVWRAVSCSPKSVSFKAPTINQRRYLGTEWWWNGQFALTSLFCFTWPVQKENGSFSGCVINFQRWEKVDHQVDGRWVFHGKLAANVLPQPVVRVTTGRRCFGLKAGWSFANSST